MWDLKTPQNFGTNECIVEIPSAKLQNNRAIHGGEWLCQLTDENNNVFEKKLDVTFPNFEVTDMTVVTTGGKTTIMCHTNYFWKACNITNEAGNKGCNIKIGEYVVRLLNYF